MFPMKNSQTKFVFKSVILFALVQIFIGCSAGGFSTFISTSNDKLIDGEDEFRFVSFNIPNLLYIEDNFRFEETNPWRLPNEFEIRDALTSIKQMGGKVARTYTITVKRKSDPPELKKHVEAPGIFNEEAFQVLDKVVEIANETNVRLIIPLVDNWWWMGGIGEYAEFRGMPRVKFWSDSLIISDFKKTIEFILNRKNTFTGTLYKNEMAILGWETGNELESTNEWQTEIAKYIKSIDSNHLVIENIHSPVVYESSIKNPYIDVLSTHFYEQSNSAVNKIKYNCKLINGRKPYFIGEFGFIPSYQFSEILDTVINNNVSGALLWSLRFRNRDGGFYKHYEKFGFAAYNWPGFAFNNPYKEKAVLNLIKTKAKEITNLKTDSKKILNTPKILTTNDITKISWQGSTGAISYVIERKELDNDWRIIDVVNDAEISYNFLFSDNNAEKGKSYFYRMRAWNGETISKLSNTIGPIKVDRKRIIDEFFNDSKMFKKSNSIKFLSMEDLRKAKEDRSRITGLNGDYIIYEADDAIKNITIDCYQPTPESNIEIFVSSDGSEFKKIIPKVNEYSFGKNDYDFFNPIRFSASNLLQDYKFLKIAFMNKIQISRVEIEY